MLLPREFIEYLVRQLVQRLSPSVFEVTDPKVASDLIQSIVIEEMETEDRLNDEVREILTVEEKADRNARTKVHSMKREITEGTEEYSLLHKRYYAEELKKLGIDFNA